jgi:hypothetical protein
MFIFLCRFAPGGLTLCSAGLKKRKKAPGDKLSALTRFPDNAECGKNLACSSRQLAASANCRFEFHKSGQFFSRTRNETLSVVAAIMVSIVWSIGGTDRPFQFHKRGQLFIRMYNKAPSVVSVRVCNEDCFPAGIDC